MKDKTKLESMVSNLSDKLKSEQVSNAGHASKLATEQRKTAELVRILICYQQIWYQLKKNEIKNVYILHFQEKKVASMEEELNDIEDMRLTVLNMMTKRKKGANKENLS